MKLKGSNTEKNLLAAYSGELASVKLYTDFAEVARKEGFEQIANIFLVTAENEKEHARVFSDLLEGEIGAITLQNGIIGTTIENLKYAVAEENKTASKTYPGYGAEAYTEGLLQFYNLFDKICAIERHHEERFSKFLENMIEEKIFKQDVQAMWRCLKCGYDHYNREPPPKCPVCEHPKNYFEMPSLNY
jgi:rubrerythrin